MNNSVLSGNLPKISRIAVICRANEIRSRIVEAIISEQFKYIEVKTFGTSVSKNVVIDERFVNSMKNWGLNLKLHPPRPIEYDLEFLSTADLVIAADSQVYSRVHSLNTNCVNLIDFAIDQIHEPIDPVNLSKSSFLQNVSKVIHCTYRLIDALIAPYSPKYEILAVIPSKPNFSYVPREGQYVIDSTFIRNQGYVLTGQNVHWFNEMDLENGSLTASVSKHISLYASKFEFVNPERSLVSRQWEQFVRKVASTGPTDVITQPLKTGNSELWQFSLASRLAQRVKYI